MTPSYGWYGDDFTGATDTLATLARRGRRAFLFLRIPDPQQLAQPSQAVHPGGSGASALEHLLDGHATIPPERGVFLDRSYRMHPDLTAFLSDLAYEGRLDEP